MSEHKFHWTELRGPVKGLVNTAQFAAEPVRAEHPVEVAEFSDSDDTWASADVFGGPGSFAPRESYEDAVFSEEDQMDAALTPRWYLDQQDRVSTAVARDSSFREMLQAGIDPAAIDEAIDVMAAMPWSSCE